MMIEAQALRISVLNTTIQRMQRELHLAQDELARYKKAGDFYLDLQNSIKECPTLQSEWKRFCMFLKMSIPDDRE